MTEERHYLPYFEAMHRKHDPVAWRELLDELGTPADVRQRRLRIESLLRRDEHRAVIWRFLKQAGLAFIAVASLLSLIKAILPAGVPW